MLKYKIYNLIQSYETNTYLVWDTDSSEAILIDPAAPSDLLRNDIRQLNLYLKMIINTHGHGDHIGGNKFFSEQLACPIAIQEKDASLLCDPNQNFTEIMGLKYEPKAASILFKENETFYLGQSLCEIIHTPGHTAGGLVIYADPYLFSGDTLFYREIGRTDLPNGNYHQLISSIRTRLFVLPNDTIVLPGHGESTTIGDEKKDNPYCSNSARYS